MASTIVSFDTILPADSVEVHHRSQTIAVGTYFHEEGTRRGKIWLLDTRGNVVDEEQGEDGAAVFDMTWNQNDSILAVALAAPVVRFDKLVQQEHRQQLVTVASVSVVGEAEENAEAKRKDRMCVSLGWNGRHNKVCVSHNDGYVSIIDVAASKVTSCWKGHEYEVWTAAFVGDDDDGDVLWTGADDGFLKGWDVRQNSHIYTFTHQKGHGNVGVCCIAPHRRRDFVIATGSYDETVRIWDKRQMQAPLSEEKMGGGVWRLKWAPTDHNRDESNNSSRNNNNNNNHNGNSNGDCLLAACMHNGFHIVSYDQAFLAGRKIVQYVGPHASLAYGADWVSSSRIACCSFYDHVFSICQLGDELK